MQTVERDHLGQMDAIAAAVQLLILTHPDRPQFARTLRQFGNRRILELQDEGADESVIESTKSAFNRLIVLADMSAGTIQ